MFQRSNSRRGSLSRRKSTSSVYSKHESIDPEVARQYAQTAAVLAFTRANAGTSADGGLSRNTNHQERSRMSREDNSVVENDQPVVRRQQSVRFAGPNAIPRRQTIGTRALQNPIVPKASSSSLRPRAVTTDAPVPAQYRPPSRSSSIGKASIGRGTNASFVTALAYDEYYTREDDVASTPSSYRKIRKSKSMFSPLKAPSVFYTNGTPDSRFSGDQPTLVETTPQESATSTHGGLRAPRSMSFLRGGRDHELPSTRQRNDVAVQVARDKYLHDVEQQRLRAQPSFLFRSRKAREEKPFRQSVRSSSGNGYGNSVVSSNPLTSPKESGLKGKARRASEKIKTKLRKVFGTSPESNEGIMIPYQQVEAPKTHVRKYNGDAEVRNDSFLGIPHPAEAAVFRVTSSFPAVHPATSNQQLRSAAGSVRSMRSDGIADEKSRVTSWAVSSSNNNTISSLARAQNEANRYEQQHLSSHSRAEAEADKREQQRLSIINEHGTHHSSSTFARRRLTNQYSAYPVIPSHRPSKSASHHSAPLPGPVDSARLCSALMKRLDENSPQAKLAASRKNSADSFAEKQIPPRTSSVDRHDRNRGRSRTPATIRRVTTEDTRIIGIGGSGGSGESVQHHPQYPSSEEIHSTSSEYQSSNSSRENRAWAAAVSVHGLRGREHENVLSPNCTNNENNGIGGHGHTEFDSKAPGLPQNKSIRSIHTARSSEDQARIAKEQLLLDQGWSPQEIAIRNEPTIPPRPVEVKKKELRESRSTFFGGSAMTIPRTTSPYRRALAETTFDYNPAVATDNSPVHISGQLKNPLLLTDENKAPVAIVSDDEDPQRVYSESIYSRTTSGQTPVSSNSNLVLHMGNENMIPFANSGPIEILSPENRQRLYSESAYSNWSRVTSNPTPAGSASNPPLTMENKTMVPISEPDMADLVIVDQAVYRPSNPGEVQDRVTSSGGSNEWKGWMSSQVAVLERPKNNDSTSTIATHQSINYALPSMPRSYKVANGHRREHAQIDDEDSEVLPQRRSNVKQPVGILQQNTGLRLVTSEEHAARESFHLTPEVYTTEEMPQRNISNFINDLRMQGGPNRQRNSQHNTNFTAQPSPAGALQHQNIPFLKPILKNRSDPSLIELNTTSQATIPTPPPMPLRSPLRQTQNKGSIGSRTPNSVKGSITPTASIGPIAGGRNKLHKRNTSQGTLRGADTPAKSLRGSHGSQVTLKLFDVPVVAGKLVKRNSSHGRTSVCGRENEKYDTEVSGELEFGGARKDQGTGDEKRKDDGVEKFDAQQLGSRRMVDLFLSSRRRRITGSEESAPNAGAFL